MMRVGKQANVDASIISRPLLIYAMKNVIMVTRYFQALAAVCAINALTTCPLSWIRISSSMRKAVSMIVLQDSERNTYGIARRKNQILFLHALVCS
jgi:hypothetical protein